MSQIENPPHSHLREQLVPLVDRLLQVVAHDEEFRSTTAALLTDGKVAGQVTSDQLHIMLLSLVAQRIDEYLVYHEQWDTLRLLVTEVKEFHSCLQARSIITELLDMLPSSAVKH